MIKAVTTPWHVKVEPHQLPLLILGFTPASPRGIPHEVLDVGERINLHVFKSASRRSDLTPSEDKWFVYTDGPDHRQQVRIHMHRSWTGCEMMVLFVDAGYDGCGSGGNGARILSITWENDEEARMKDGDAAMYKEVAREVCDWVLNVKLGPAEADDGQLGGRRNVPTAGTLLDAYHSLPPGDGSSSVYWADYPQENQ